MVCKRAALFRGRHFTDEIIVLCVRWYLRYSLSYRGLAEIMCERNLFTDPATIWRWVQRYAPELNERVRRELKPTNDSWRTDETYVRVAGRWTYLSGRWTYLYRAVDSTGATIDFLVSALRDADAAKRLFRKALSAHARPQPRVVNTDLALIYTAAVLAIKKEGCCAADVTIAPSNI
jgi:transposase-like protein